MTYVEFRDVNYGQYLDYDGSYGSQCWDLAQFYFTQVLNVPDSVLSGCGWVKNMVLWDWKYQEMMEYFDEVSTIDMQQGDVCIWTGGDGHIAIFDHYDPNDNNCYYFSQNPNPCEVIPVNMEGHHCFRRKKEVTPDPTPVIVPNVERDEYNNQIEVCVPELRVRDEPSLDSSVLGYANEGLYNYFETCNKDDYLWYKIGNRNWIASSDEWTKVYPRVEDEYISLKVLEHDGDYCKVDMSNFYVRK